MINSIKLLGLIVMIAGAATFSPVALAQPARLEATDKRPMLHFDPTEFNSYIDQGYRKAGLPGIAVAVVRRDEVLLLQGYGVREAGKPAKVDASTLFNVGSITKSFTAALVATDLTVAQIRRTVR